MTRYALSSTARRELADIYQFTLGRWGETQAETYVGGLFQTFAQIGENVARARSLARYDVEGWVTAYRSHLIYWRRLESGHAAIVTVLHQHMVQADRVRVAFDPEPQAHPSST